MLVLLRHGQSVANAENRKAGHTNSPLTEEGKSQARDVQDTYRGYSWDAIFCSDLVRCQDTLRIIMGDRHPPETWTLVEELRERSGGIYEGMTYPEIRKILPPKKYKLWQRDYFEAPQMGESMKDVEDRVIPYAREYIFPLVNEGKNVFVCTHHIPMKVLIGYIKGMNETDIPSLNIEHAMPYVTYGTVRL